MSTLPPPAPTAVDLEARARALLSTPPPVQLRTPEEYAAVAGTPLERELVNALRLERARTDVALAEIGHLIAELERYGAKVDEAVRIGQKRTEAMRDHAIECFDAVMRVSAPAREAFLAELGGSTINKERTANGLPPLEEHPERAASKRINFMDGEIGRFGSGVRQWPGEPPFTVGEFVWTCWPRTSNPQRVQILSCTRDDRLESGWAITFERSLEDPEHLPSILTRLDSNWFTKEKP